MQRVSGLVACGSVDNGEGAAANGVGRGQFLSRNVFEADVFPRCSGSGEDEISALSQGLSDLRVAPVDQSRYIPVTKPEWHGFGALSCLPVEIIGHILSFLPAQDFRALFCTAKMFKTSDLVREAYLKRAVNEICNRYYGGGSRNFSGPELTKRHFSQHMDTAINRLRQVVPVRDMSLIETTLRKNPLYTAGLFRKLSNEGQLTYKERTLNTRTIRYLDFPLINLPGSSKLLSTFRHLTIWDAGGDITGSDRREIEVGKIYDATNCAVFPDGQIAVSRQRGTIDIFDLSQPSERQLLRTIRIPGYKPHALSSLKVINNETLIAACNGSLWVFDLRRREGCELVRKIKHGDFPVVDFLGLLPDGELVSFDGMNANLIKVWQPLGSGPEFNVPQAETCIKSIPIDGNQLLQAMLLNQPGQIAVWSAGYHRPIMIIDVNRPPGQEEAGSIDIPGRREGYRCCCAPVNTADGKLLAGFKENGRNAAGYCVVVVAQLTEARPIVVREVMVLTDPGGMINSLKQMPDGRIMVMLKRVFCIIDLTKPPGQETREIISEVSGDDFLDAENPNNFEYGITMLSGELSVLAHYHDGERRIKLLDYCAVKSFS